MLRQLIWCVKHLSKKLCCVSRVDHSLPYAVISSKLHWIEHANIFQVQSFGCLQLFLFSSCLSDPEPWGCKSEKSKDTWWKRWRKEDIHFRNKWTQDELYCKSEFQTGNGQAPARDGKTHKRISALFFLEALIFLGDTCFGVSPINSGIKMIFLGTLSTWIDLNTFCKCRTYRMYVALAHTTICRSTLFTCFFWAGMSGLCYFLCFFHLWPMPEKSPVKVLLLAYGRTGSSLTGDLISGDSEAAYFFEPFW